jgi:hypothetical protein
MDLAVADWSLAQLVRCLLYGSYAGSVALLLGVDLVRPAVRALGRHHHLAPRFGGVALLLLGVAGWVLPWCAIVTWYRVHAP